MNHNVQDYYDRHNTDIAWQVIREHRGTVDSDCVHAEARTPHGIIRQMRRAHELLVESGLNPDDFSTWRSARASYRKVVRRLQRQELTALRRLHGHRLIAEAGR